MARRDKKNPEEPEEPRRSKWDHAVSPLQRARHDYRMQQDEAILHIRAACPGHAGHPCRLDPSKLSEYENGRRPPSLVHLQAMCEAYQRSAEDLGLITWRKRKDGADRADARDFPQGGKDPNVPFRTDGRYPDRDLESLVLTLRGTDLTQLASLAGETEGSTAVDRNTFLKGVGTVAGAAATDPFIALTQVDRAALNATSVSVTALEQLEQAAYLHARGYYDMHLPGRVESLVRDWASAGRLLHQSQTPSQRIRLSESYARLSSILGHYSYDNDNNARAVALYSGGMDAAREAGDNDLFAWLCERHADVLTYEGDPRERVAWAERGLDVARGGESLTVARLHGVAASTYAAIGNRRWSAAHFEECERILNKDVAGCWPSDRSMPRGYSYTPDALIAHRARAHLELGEYAKAVDLYGETIARKKRLGMSASAVPAFVLNQLHLATALVHSGELQEAADSATTAIQEYDGVATPRILSRAHDVESVLTAADPGGTYARDFSEFLREQGHPPLET